MNRCTDPNLCGSRECHCSILDVDQVAQEAVYLNLNWLSLITNSSSFTCFMEICSLAEREHSRVASAQPQ